MNTASTVHAKAREIAAVIEAEIVADLGLAEGESLDRHMTFVDLGLDSASVVVVCGAASEHLGFEVPTEWLFDQPTIHDLAHFLAEKAAHPEAERA